MREGGISQVKRFKALMISTSNPLGTICELIAALDELAAEEDYDAR